MDSKTETSPAVLTTLLNFTAEELALNRSGQLSNVQQNRLKKLQSRLLLMGGAVFLGLVLLSTLALFGGQSGDNPILTLIGFLLTGVNAILTGMFGRQWMRLNADLRQDSVLTISGTLERILRPSRQANNYVLRVNQIDFPVDKDTFKAFQHEATYSLYQTRHAGILMSAEQI